MDGRVRRLGEPGRRGSVVREWQHCVTAGTPGGRGSGAAYPAGVGQHPGDRRGLGPGLGDCRLGAGLVLAAVVVVAAADVDAPVLPRAASGGDALDVPRD